MQEAHAHPHNQARNAFIDVAGHRQPAPAPRFSATPLGHPRPPGSVPVEETLAAWGLTEAEITTIPSV
jgi:alpha-methylacyl-CoA racemase